MKKPLELTTDMERYYLEGELIRFNIPDINNRIIDYEEFKPHLEHLQEKINKKVLFGELDHPVKFDISLRNVSHQIIELDVREDEQGKYLYGKFKILNTDKGLDLFDIV